MKNRIGQIILFSVIVLVIVFPLEASAYEINTHKEVTIKAYGITTITPNLITDITGNALAEDIIKAKLGKGSMDEDDTTPFEFTWHGVFVAPFTEAWFRYANHYFDPGGNRL
ncbi:MAG: hypothetical protein OEV59_02870 [Deltaproteobacteria bacterium]|nr:hypothetical protein [Deltaproteobacteria bacterium]